MDMEIEQTAQAPLEKDENLASCCNCENDMKNLIKRVKRLEILSYIIVFLIALSIVLPLAKDTTNKPKLLPANIDPMNIIQTLQEAYNSPNNGEKLYNVLGDWAKTKTSQEQTVKAMSATHTTLGKLTNVRYNNYKYMGNNDGADWFLLDYIGAYESGSGIVDVQIRVIDGKWEITAFTFNVNVIK